MWEYAKKSNHCVKLRFFKLRGLNTSGTRTRSRRLHCDSLLRGSGSCALTCGPCEDDPLAGLSGAVRARVSGEVSAASA